MRKLHNLPHNLFDFIDICSAITDKDTADYAEVNLQEERFPTPVNHL